MVALPRPQSIIALLGFLSMGLAFLAMCQESADRDSTEHKVKIFGIHLL
jgi:hypothetical protein